MSDEKVGRLFTGTLFTILISHTGAKLALFNSGVSARIALPKPTVPCSKFFSGH
jgi:hypothetical protein